MAERELSEGLRELNMRRKINRCLYGLFCFAFIFAITMEASQQDRYEPVIALAIDGKYSVISKEVRKGTWKGTDQHELALALLEEDGNEAIELFEKLTLRQDVSNDIKTVAWFHIFGYYRLVGDYSLQVEALNRLHENSGLAQRLFHGSIPDPNSIKPPETTQKPSSKSKKQSSRTAKPLFEDIPLSTSGQYSIQVGAFSTKKRAESFAKKTQWTGDPVRVVPQKTGKKKLYSVWVGYFPTEAEADKYGRLKFGDKPGTYKVVKKP